MNYLKLLSCSVLALSLVVSSADAARRPAKETPATTTGGYKGKAVRNKGLRTLRHKRHERMERVRKARSATKTKRSMNDKTARLKRTPRIAKKDK